MTSQKSSSNKQSKRFDLLQSFKSLIVPAILMLVTFGYELIYVPYDYLFSNYQRKVDIITSVALLNQFEYVTLITMLIAFGIMFAIAAFKPFMSKKNANFYFASPVTRADMFKNRVLASTTVITVILALMIFIDAVINCYVLKTDGYIISLAFGMFFESWVYIMSTFAIFAIGFCAASNPIQGLLFGAGLYVFPTVITVVVDFICEAFLMGYNRYSVFVEILRDSYYDRFRGESILLHTTIFNPAFFAKPFGSDRLADSIFLNCFYEFTTVNKPETPAIDFGYYLPLIIWTVVTVALIMVAKHLFVARKAENIGMVRKNKGIIGFITTELAFGVATSWIGLYSTEHIDSHILRAVIIIGGFVVSWIAFYSFFNLTIKHSKKSYAVMGGVAIVLIGMIGMTSSGLFGYSSYVPDVDDIEFATIEGTGIDMNLEPNSSNDLIFETTQYVSNKGMGIFTEKEDLEVFTNINKALISGNTDVDNCIAIEYQLKNGKRVYRRYEYVSSEGMALVPSLVDTKEFRSNLYYFLAGEGKNDFVKKTEKYGFDQYDFISGFYDYVEMNNGIQVESIAFNNDDENFVYMKDYHGIRKAIVDDFKNMTYKDIVVSDEAPLGYLTFYSTDEYSPVCDDSVYYDARCFDNSFPLAKIYVYPCMTNTIAFLKNNDLYKRLITPDSIKYNKVYYSKIGHNINAVLTCGDLFEYNKSDEWYDELIDPAKAIGEENASTDEAFIKKCMDNSIYHRFVNPDDYIVVFVNEDDNDVLLKKLIIPSSKMAKIL